MIIEGYTVPIILANFALIYWGVYTFMYVYCYILLAKNPFDQSYIHWVFEKSDNQSWLGYMLFVVWSLPSVVLEVLMASGYYIFTGNKHKLYYKDESCE